MSRLARAGAWGWQPIRRAVGLDPKQIALGASQTEGLRWPRARNGSAARLQQADKEQADTREHQRASVSQAPRFVTLRPIGDSNYIHCAVQMRGVAALWGRGAVWRMVLSAWGIALAAIAAVCALAWGITLYN